MKCRFLLLVAALLMMCSGVKADNVLYAVVDGTTMTLKYGEIEAGAVEYQYWNSDWNVSFKGTITKAVIDASCAAYAAESYSNLFRECDKLETISGLENLNTSNNKSFSYTFSGCTVLESLDLSHFDTSELTNTKGMFAACKALSSLDLSTFDTSKVKDMMYMFYNCSALKIIIVGDNWSTASIGSESFSVDMFTNCDALVGEDGTIVTDRYHYNAHTGAGGYLTNKTVTVAANTVGSDNWATYYKSNVNRQADANTTVYTAAVSGDKMTLTEISDKIIKAGQAVILKSSAASITLTSTIDDATGDFTGNVLEGVDVATDRASDNTYYVLGKGSAGIIGFYKYEGTLSANKAFYKVAAGSREYFTIEGFSTGIQEMEAVSGKKADVYYDLSGRRLAQPKKGVNIVNGKLVIIK